MVMTDVCPFTLGISISKQLGPNRYENGYFISVIEVSDKAHRFENLEFTLVGLLIFGLVVTPRGLYDSFYLRLTRIFKKTFRDKAKTRLLQSIALHQLSLQLWHHKLSDNQKKMARPLINDGDVHLAAAIWEAPRNRGED